MAQLLSNSDSHRRIRRDHASETAEDYVEAIAEITRGQGQCRVADLARRFGVTHVTVLKIVSRLDAAGLVRTKAYRPIELKVRGARLATKCRERHETVYSFLLAIGVEPKTAAIDAEGIEHHVSPATLARFRKFLETQRSEMAGRTKK